MGVHFSGHTNSTFFTDCCGCAILEDEKKCGICKKEVFPEGRRARWDQAMEKLYGGKRLREMRANYKKY